MNGKAMYPEFAVAAAMKLRDEAAERERQALELKASLQKVYAQDAPKVFAKKFGVQMPSGTAVERLDDGTPRVRLVMGELRFTLLGYKRDDEQDSNWQVQRRCQACGKWIPEHADVQNYWNRGVETAQRLVGEVIEEEWYHECRDEAAVEETVKQGVYDVPGGGTVIETAAMTNAAYAEYLASDGQYTQAQVYATLAVAEQLEKLVGQFGGEG